MTVATHFYRLTLTCPRLHRPMVPLLKIWRKIERAFKRIHRPLLMRRLKRNNQIKTRSILSSDGPVVTLTTFGKRINTVFYTIESIAEGEVLPSRLTLWLSHDEYALALPDSLQRLTARGLDIQPCIDHGPHKKYLPEVQAYPNLNIPFVTADDDTLYPQYWLKELIQSYNNNPNTIQCYRAHRIGIEKNGHFKRYKTWQKCLSSTPCHMHFSTGDCGVLFPPKMRKILNDAGEKFTDLCPRADDIWLNYNAFISGIKVNQVVSVPKRFYEVPGTRDGALSTFNNGEGGNDQQLLNTYSAADRQKLLAYTTTLRNSSFS